MQLTEITTEALFEDTDIEQLNEAVENPQWSAPVELEDFLSSLNGDNDAG